MNDVRWISFQLDDGAERPDVLGWMSEEIGRIGEANYAAAKRLLLDSVGFEDGHGIARVTLSTGSPMTLVDLQLGLIDSLELDHFSFTPSRFGIESLRPDIDVQGGTLKIMPQGRRGTLRLRSPDGQQIFLPAEVFSAVLPGRRRAKIRISAGFIDVVVSATGRVTVTCREERDRVTALDHIAGLALLRASTRATKLTMSFRADRPWTDLGYVNNAGSPAPGWKQLLFVTEALRKIATFENVDPIATSVDAINDRFVPLSVLDALISTRSMRIEFTPEEQGSGGVGALLAYSSVRFDGMELGAVASRPVTADVMIGARRRIDFGPATLLHCAIDPPGVLLLPDVYMDELDRMSEQIDVLAIGDLQRLVQEDGDRELAVDSPRRTPARLTHR